MRRNLPIVPVHDIAIRDGDLIAATHGRSFWIIDDLSVLRQLSAESIAKGSHIFTPRSTYRITWQGGFGGGGSDGGTVGANPPAGAIVYYSLKQPAKKLTLEVDYGQSYDTQDRFNWIEGPSKARGATSQMSPMPAPAVAPKQ